MIKKINVIVLLFCLNFLFFNSNVLAWDGSKDTDYDKYKSLLIRHNITITYKKKDYMVYSLKSGSHPIFFEKKTEKLVSDKNRSYDLKKLYLLGATYKTYSEMMNHIKYLTPGLIEGKSAVEKLGKIAVEATITKNVGKTFSTLLKDEISPNSLLTYGQIAWADYEYKTNILPQVESVYSKEKGVIVEEELIGDGIIVKDNNKNVETVYSNLLEGYYKWKYFLKTLDKMELTIDKNDIFTETLKVMKDGIIDSVSLNYNGLKLDDALLMKKYENIYNSLKTAKDTKSFFNTMKNFIKGGYSYYDSYIESAKKYKKEFVVHVYTKNELDSLLKK